MAKRKCLNKRLSEYNRYSVGSAILNSDTDILDDEYPYWWKDVESASMARTSINLNAFNQSSRQLDSTSQIETSQVPDEWWKVLEISNIQNSRKINIDNVQKDSNIVTTSESEEESRIVKKKFPLRSRTKKNKSNIFLNVLNDSEATTHEKIKSESLVTISTSNSKTITNFKQINEIQESSLNQSEVGNVLKLKPNIYKKNYKNRNKNVFSDVLKENQLETSQKGKISSSNKAPIVTESADSATTENTVLSQPVSIQRPLSFENEHNFSPFPPPKAQSTILEDSTSSVSNSSNESNNSNTVYKILKPKSKLLTLNRKNTKKNLFENVFEKEGSLNKIEKNATADEILKHSLKSSKISKAAADTIDEQQYEPIKEVKTLSTSKIDERKISEDSTTSNDESDRNRDYSTVQRFKSKFLTRLRKNRKKNPFQDIFEENSDADTLIASPLERTLIRSTEKISTIKDPTSTQNIFKSIGNQTISKSSVIFRTNLLNNSSEDDIAMDIKGDETNTSLGKNVKVKRSSQSTTDTKLHDIKSVSNKQIMSVNNLSKQSLSQRSDSLAVVDTVAIESTATHDKPKERSSRLSKLQKSLLGSVDESKSQEVESISQRKSKRLSNKKKESVSSVLNKDESSKIQDVSKRQSKRLSKLQDDNVESTSQRSTRRSSRIREQVSPVAEIKELTKIQDTSKTQSKSLNSLSKYSFLHSTRKQEQEGIENISQRSIRSLSRIQEQTVSPAAEIGEPTKIQSISQRQSNRLSNLSKYSFLHSTSKEEQEGIENIPQRSIRSLSRMQEQTVSLAAETNELLKIQDISKTQSKRLSNVSKYSSLHSTSKQKPEGIKNMSQRSIRSLSRMQERSVSPAAGTDESTKIQNISKRQSKHLSNLSKHSANMQELKDIEKTLQQNIRSLSSLQEQSVSSATDTDESTDTQNISKRQSKRLNSLSKNLSLHSTNMQELEDIKNTSQRNIRSLSRVQEQLVSSATDTDESTENQDISKRHGKSLSKLEIYNFPRPTTEQKGKNKLTLQRSIKSLNRMQEHSLSPVAEVDEKIKNVSKIRSRSLSRVSKRLSSDYTSEEEGDDVESISQKNTGNSKRVQTQLVAEVNERIQDIPEEQGNRLSKSKHLSLQSAERGRHSDAKSIPQKSRSMSTMRKQSASFVTEADKPSEIKDISKNQIKSSNRTSKRSSLRFTNVEDLEDDENFVHHSIKSLSRTQNDKAEIQSTKDILNSRSNRTNMLQKCLVLLTREDMIEELIKNNIAKQKDNANKATKQFEDVGKDISSSQSNIFDKTRTRTYSFNRSDTSSEFEMEDIIRRPKRRKTIQLDELSEDENDPVENREITRKIYVTDCFNMSEDESVLSSVKKFNVSSNKIYRNLNSLNGLMEENNATKKLDNRFTLNSSKKDLSGFNFKAGNFSKGKGSISVTFRNGEIENRIEHTDKDEDNFGKPSRANISYLSVSRGQTIGENHKRESSKFTLDSNILTNKKHQSTLNFEVGNFSKGKESISISSRNKVIENELQHTDTDESNFGKSFRARTSHLSVSKGQTIEENRKRASSQFALDSSIPTNKKRQSTLNFEARNFSKGKESISITSRNEDIENGLQYTDTDESNFGKSLRARTSHLFVSKGQTIGENWKGASSKPESLMSSIIRARLESESKVSKRQQSIKNFLISDKALPASQMSENKERVEEIRQELEKIKKLEIAHTKENEKKHERKPAKLKKNINEAGRVKKSTSQKQRLRKPTKPIHKAFLVNGQVYKVKRLPRPQRWVTDRLYNYLWKRMEPKYKLETKSISEKFIHQLSNVTTVISKRKSYLHYKSELFVLMKEMARLGIIRTRNDFYNFCHDFFPYSLRIKTVPMLLPGNKRNIPYNAKELHEPLFDS